MIAKYYPVTIGSVVRDLPICDIHDDIAIAVFNVLGDVEVTIAAARALLSIASDFDVLITAEAKSIPLIYEMARMAGKSNYVIARKSEKSYAKSLFSTEVQSITTAAAQHLYLSDHDAAIMKHQRVLIIDDVISTGHTLDALVRLVQLAEGHIVGKMAVFAEGDANLRSDILCLGTLPIFHR